MAKQAPYNKLAPLAELVNEDPELAVEPLEELARRYPSDSQVLYALGVAHLNLGEFDDAVERLEAAAKREKQAITEVNGALARAYSYAGMPAHAHRAASKAGMNLPPWREAMSGDLPPTAKLNDLIAFEENRRHLTRVGPKTQAALRQMQAFTKRFPTYLPALNVTTTGLFLQGKFGEARDVIEQVLGTDPHNVHALLNLARIERLLGGVQAVEAMRERVEAARHDVTGGALALANLYLLMNDARAAQAVLDRHLPQQTAKNTANDETDEAEPLSPEAQQLQEFLRRAQDNPGAPLLLPSELLPQGWFQRWRSLTGQGVSTIEKDLQSIPGWFENIEQGVVFEQGLMATLFSTLLVNPEFTLPDGVSRGERVQRFIALLQEGRGSMEGLVGVGQGLQRLDLLPEGMVARDPDGNEIAHLSLELVDEPLDHMDSREDLRQYERAMDLVRSGDFTQAVRLFDALLLEYPDHPSLVFNRATVYASMNDPDSMTRAVEDMERLLVEHPEYLFPRAQLAMLALHAEDLQRARELLVFPKGLKRLHVQEYGFFAAVQAVLALREGDLEVARRILPVLRQILDEDAMPIRLLKQQIALHLREHPEAALELLDTLL